VALAAGHELADLADLAELAELADLAAPGAIANGHPGEDGAPRGSSPDLCVFQEWLNGLTVAAVTAMRLSIALVLAFATTAAASPVDRPAEPRSENTALALSLGGELASLALLSVQVVYGEIRGGCGSSDLAAVETTSDRCNVIDNSVMPGLAIVGAAGLVVAPSFGHWYAGGGWTRGMKLRLAGLGIATLGSMAISSWDEDGLRPDRMPGAIVPAIGVALFAIGTVDDIATARRAVRKRNAAIGDLTVTPTATANGASIMLAGRF
jgi:hypothetical protein